MKEKFCALIARSTMQCPLLRDVSNCPQFPSSGYDVREPALIALRVTRICVRCCDVRDMPTPELSRLYVPRRTVQRFQLSAIWPLT